MMKIVDGFQFVWTRNYRNLIAVALSGDGKRLLTSCLETSEISLSNPGTLQRADRNPSSTFSIRRSISSPSTHSLHHNPITYLVTRLHEASTGKPIGTKLKWETLPNADEHIKLVMDHKGHTALIAYPVEDEWTVKTQVKAWSCESLILCILYEGIFEECIDLSISPDGCFGSVAFINESTNTLPPNAIRVFQLRRGLLSRAQQYMFDLPNDEKLIGGKAGYQVTSQLGLVVIMVKKLEQISLLGLMTNPVVTHQSEDLDIIITELSRWKRLNFNVAAWSPPNVETHLTYLHYPSSSEETIFATTHQVVISNLKSGHNLVRSLPIHSESDGPFEFKIFPTINLCAILSGGFIWLLDASYFQLYRKFKLPGIGKTTSETLSLRKEECICIISHCLDTNDVTCFEIPYNLTKRASDEGNSVDLSDRVSHNHKLIGSGGFGDIYKATWNCYSVEGSPEVAIKVIRFPTSNLKEAKAVARRHAREVAVWKKVDHVNIVPFLGVVSNEALSSIVSRWMPNGTARTFLRSHPNYPCLDIIKGVGNGLHFLHSRTPVIIHGDMKADNILIDEAGSPRITDFGISHLLDPSTFWYTSRSSAVGSFRWMSPELMRADEPRATTASDVYAFAMTVIEIITGELPFARKYPRDEQVMLNVCLNNDRPQKPDAEECTDLLWELLVNCWEMIPSQRCSMTQVIEHLDSIASQVRPLRVLCIDHSYSRMSAVFAYLRTLEAQLNLTTDLGEQFDLICGSAFGGFIALLLGILGLSVDECFAEYLTLCLLFHEISERKGAKPFEWMHLYDREVEYHLEKLINRYGFDPKSRLTDFQFSRPRVFLIGDNHRCAFERRSYLIGDINERPWMTLTLHAAFIHTVFLLSGYVDILAADSALKEARKLYGKNRVIGCFISCGIGASAHDVSTYTRVTIDNVRTKLVEELGDAYICFDVKEYLENLPEGEFSGVWSPVVGANDWRILRIVGVLGKRYMQSTEGRSKLQRCLERLDPIRKKRLVSVSDTTEMAGEETSIEGALELLSILGHRTND